MKLQRRKFIIVASCVVCILFPLPSSATTVIAIVEAHRIILAADSMFRGSAGVEQRCKIEVRKPNCVFTIVGLRSQRETSFDSGAVAKASCDATSSVDGAAKLFGERVRAALAKAMDQAKRNSPDVYKGDYKGKTVLEVIFAGFDQGRPKVAAKSFFLDQNDKLVEHLTSVPDQAGNSVIMSGETASARAEFPNIPRNATTEQRVKRMIQKQMEATPLKVGPPVTILTIARFGHTWVEPGLCNVPKSN